jgi:hypothetical protein
MIAFREAFFMAVFIPFIKYLALHLFARQFLKVFSVFYHQTGYLAHS